MLTREPTAADVHDALVNRTAVRAWRAHRAADKSRARTCPTCRDPARSRCACARDVFIRAFLVRHRPLDETAVCALVVKRLAASALAGDEAFAASLVADMLEYARHDLERQHWFEWTTTPTPSRVPTML